MRLKFDVTGNLKNFTKFFGIKQGLSSENFLDFGPVAFSFLFDKHYSIMN